MGRSMMRKLLFTVTIVVFGLAQSGCGAHQLCHDQDKLRCCLLDLYTNQIMDNLVRAHNGLPIIQLDYSQITAAVTLEASGSYGGNQQVGTSNLSNLPQKTLSITRSFTN